MLHHAHQLYDYNFWANDRLFAHLQQLPEDVFNAEITSVFPTVSVTLGHMYVFEMLFMSVLSGLSNEAIYPEMMKWRVNVQGRTLAEMQELFAEAARQFRELLDRTPDPDKPITIEHPSYGRMDTRFSDILQHVVNHGTYHRGNVTAMLRQQGHTGVSTDYIFYLAERVSI
ncbi:damage-inducible protein DinB [Paenibacillus sp. PR3]|uniref:Damage-inducible protein DinB n=1 Tax=Paenibacillus terricola TaxID=2763503 RepID=A0ABR8MWP3_9BACL|nr:DinB family protein [Paenibacillus terricola]MBD3920394.1 damage-inducible protein DinB [Paenibacillus terricola]